MGSVIALKANLASVIKVTLVPSIGNSLVSFHGFKSQNEYNLPAQSNDVINSKKGRTKSTFIFCACYSQNIMFVFFNFNSFILLVFILFVSARRNTDINNKYYSKVTDITDNYYGKITDINNMYYSKVTDINDNY